MTITPPLGDVLADKILQGFKSLKAQPQRWPAYDGTFQHRDDFLTASEVTGCERRLYYEKHVPQLMDANGAEVRDRWAGVQERGHDVEVSIVNRLTESLTGSEWLMNVLDGQRTLYHDELMLSGTPDGFLVDGGIATLLEFKSVDPRTNLEGMSAPRPKHVAQMHVNYFLSNIILPEFYGFAVAPMGAIYYGCASDYTRGRSFSVSFAPEKVNQTVRPAIAKAAKLFAERNSHGKPMTDKDMLPEGINSGDCQFCAFKEACNFAGTGMVAKKELSKVTPTFAPRGIAGTLRALLAAKERKDAAASAYEEQADDLKAMLMAAGEQVASAGGVTATITPVAGRKTLDLDAYAKATKVSPDPYYKTGAPSVRLEVSQTSEGSENV